MTRVQLQQHGGAGLQSDERQSLRYPAGIGEQIPVCLATLHTIGVDVDDGVISMVVGGSQQQLHHRLRSVTLDGAAINVGKRYWAVLTGKGVTTRRLASRALCNLDDAVVSRRIGDTDLKPAGSETVIEGALPGGNELLVEYCNAGGIEGGNVRVRWQAADHHNRQRRRLGRKAIPHETGQHRIIDRPHSDHISYETGGAVGHVFGRDKTVLDRRVRQDNRAYRPYDARVFPHR
ncbi:MAG TPA: hypothetical protein VF003_15895 [Pseudonocardiaceae bacterium]